MTADKPKPKLWTPEDLANYLGVPVSWIYKRTRKKNAPESIPLVRLGKYIRFDPESQAFRDWLAYHRSVPEPGVPVADYTPAIDNAFTVQ